MGRIKNNNKGLSLVFIDREETEGTMMLNIRNEKETDYKLVEDITRKAFYNMYIPGCIEHYLVHIMRRHEDFIPELDFVLELDGKVIGNIMYTKAELTDEAGNKKEIVTFGPISILPEYQRKGYGKCSSNILSTARLSWDMKLWSSSEARPTM